MIIPCYYTFPYQRPFASILHQWRLDESRIEVLLWCIIGCLLCDYGSDFRASMTLVICLTKYS